MDRADQRRAIPIARLTRRPDFLAAAKGRRAQTALFALQANSSAEAEAAPRLGMTITRKTGCAVERNRMRRRLREAVRRVAPFHARPGHDYVIVARRPLLDAAFDAILTDLASVFRRVHTPSSPKPARSRAPAS